MLEEAAEEAAALSVFDARVPARCNLSQCLQVLQCLQAWMPEHVIVPSHIALTLILGQGSV